MPGGIYVFFVEKYLIARYNSRVFPLSFLLSPEAWTLIFGCLCLVFEISNADIALRINILRTGLVFFIPLLFSCHFTSVFWISLDFFKKHVQI